MYRKYIKRLLDIIISLVSIVILSPLMFTISIIVMMDVGFPIVFSQRRVGKNEKIFTMYKFRTMKDTRNEYGELLPDEERQTKIGKALRSTSIDELPELINILKGDLSLVGPRPLLVSYLPYYTDEERLRHTVRGGLTVPEVIYGNVTPTWEEQFSYEIDYVKNLSFLLDVKILWYTLKILIKRVENDYGSEVRIPLNEERKQMIGRSK